MPVPSKGSQLNIYGMDKIARKKFKTLCKKLGYSMNEVMLEIIEAILEAPDERNLRTFFKVMRDGKL